MNKLSNIVQNLSLTKKTRMLILSTAIGILIVGIVSSFMVFGMKNNIDRLFLQRTLSLVKLQEIKDVYNQNILYTYRDLINKKISYNDAKEVITLATNIINNKWIEYTTSKKIYQNEINLFFSIDRFVIDNFLEKIPSTNLYNEQKIYNKLKEEISSLQYTINEIDTEYTNKNIDKAIYLINNRIYPTIDSTNIYLSQLTNYILKKAISEKDDTDMLFQATFWIIFFVIIWVVVVSVFFAHYILENIKNINISLEKKVNIKTKELQMLNSSLEDRIKEEIKISRLKDEMIFQQAKLASMGEMLANIAHQWRQPLNALTLLIQSFYFKSINKKLTEEFVQTQSDEGLKIAKSMSDTINEFRNYFKPDVQKSDFDINEAIDNALFLIDGEMKKSKINIIFEQDDEIHLEGFVNSFTQVVINIVTNAKDALNESEVDDKTILIETKESNRYVIIEISDNGGGIDEEIIDRIFEPYFTTKHQTVGTGIGLYMSKNIINEHFNGNLEVKNCIIHLLDNSYKGVKFTIMLDKN